MTRAAVRGKSLHPVRGLALLLLVGSLTSVAVAAAQEARTEESWRGLPLPRALERIREMGLPLIYSNDLVQEEMIVQSEPRGSSVYQLLGKILAPHGLTMEIGPGGTVLVVRATPPPRLEIEITEPRMGQPVAGAVDLAASVQGTEPVDAVEFRVNGKRVGVDDSPPFRIHTRLVGEVEAWEIEATARSPGGATASASIAVPNLVVREEVQVALREIAVTATHRSGDTPDLERENFLVYENGERMEIVSFDRGDAPVTLVVLVDASESMRGGLLETAIATVDRFLGHLGPRDESMVVAFGDTTRAVTPFGTDPEELLAPLLPLEPGGGTALNDHLYLALRSLDGRSGRPVVVLLSDGVEILSALDVEHLKWKVRRSEALVYWLRLGGESEAPSFTSAWRTLPDNRRQYEGLLRLVEQSGGRLLEVEEPGQLMPALDRLWRELEEQFLLGYYPPTGASGWRDVSVEIDVPGVRLQYRDGYEAKDSRRKATLTSGRTESSTP
ncbi:MAG: VWA domain-containing protein [Thermoanaerobaculia bacterium]|nr:VWA domain-containing protein [Thermoanaerobaculia bacterium]